MTEVRGRLEPQSAEEGRACKDRKCRHQGPGPSPGGCHSAGLMQGWVVHGRASVESFKARRDSDTHSGCRDPGSRKTEPLVTETVAQAIDLNSEG